MSDKPRRWSHSALEEYTRCGERFRLKRVQRVPATVYFNAVAGRAFHSWTEDFDRFFLNSGEPADETWWPDYLDAAIIDQLERNDSPPREEWKVSGTAKAKPDKESFEHWRDELGPDLCKKYIEWRGNTDTVIAIDLPPDENGNTTGIEYACRFTIGTTEVVAYIDRLEYDINGNLGVVDIKAGARKQVTLQKPTYRLAAQKQTGLPVSWGALYEARKGKMETPEILTGWTELKLAHSYEQAAAMEAAGFYLPNPTADCSWCPVRQACAFRL